MRHTLRAIFDAAVAAVAPRACLPAFLPSLGNRPTRVVGAGKAAASMAQVLVEHYGDAVTGVVVAPYGHGLPAGPWLGRIEILAAAHPVTDDAGLAAGTQILRFARETRSAQRLVVLLSGGASALLEVPAKGLRLADIQAVNRALLAAGADIAAINCVRKKLSAIKGGRMALAAAPAEVLVLAISDVPGDRLADIGSGPCSPDVTSLADARDVLRRYGCQISRRVRAALDDDRNETPGPEHPAFRHVSGQIIGRAADALAAAAAAARAAGFEPVLLGDDIDTDARSLAADHARLVLDHRRQGHRCAMISGGEVTVRVTNPRGRGGPNTAYLLHLSLAMGDTPGVWALSADTDGIDGTGDNAGAILTPDTLHRADQHGLDARALLADNQSYHFFAALGDLVITGPTRTNVNDLRVILISPD